MTHGTRLAAIQHSRISANSVPRLNLTDNPQAQLAQRSTQPFLSYPGVLARLLTQLGGRNTLDEQIIDCLPLDPGMALHALEIYGLAHPGETLRQFCHADLLHGIDICALKNSVFTAATDQLRRPADASHEAYWRLALRSAVLSHALAEKSNYPSPDEAWLAGLLTWLPEFHPAAIDNLEAARQFAQQALDRLPLRTFLADALRYLPEPMQRLRDAAPLVQLSVAAHRLARLDRSATSRQENVPPLDALFFAEKIPPQSVLELLNKTDSAVNALFQENSCRDTAQMALELIRYNQLEIAASGIHASSEAAILSLSNLLASQENLSAPIYLQRNPQSGLLEGRALGTGATPPISISIEGSKTAAARAWLTRSAGMVLKSAGNNAAILDLQLIHQANAEGLIAIPVGEGDHSGVLLACGSASAISAVASSPRHFTRLGELAGRMPARSVATEAANEASAGLPIRVRRAAHEVNNPLGIIKNYLAILKVKLGDDAPIVDELRIIHEELDRIVRIVRGLTQNKIDLAGTTEDSDLNTLIQDLLKVTQPTWNSKGIEVSTQLASGLARRTRDSDKLKQIVLNLLLNAIEATPPGGNVHIETATLLNHRHERFTEILISDSGPGIAPHVANQIFDPLDTAKGDDHAGLGLSIVKSLTESMQAGISFKTGNFGTTFQVLLPTD